MDPELKMRVEWDEVRAAFVAAKKTRDKDPDGYAKAKAAMGQMRTHWRQIRDAAAVEAEGTAALTTISTKASTQ